MPQLSDFLSTNTGSGAGKFQLLAGATINQNDAVEMGPFGKAYPVQVTDYAAVANCNYGTAQTNAATGQIVAQTQIVAGQTAAYLRQAGMQADDGGTFTFTSQSGANGLMLTKYSSSGSVVAQVNIDSAAITYYNHSICRCANGNVAVSAVNGSNQIYYAVYDQNLQLVKAVTPTAESVYCPYFSMCALSAGGFAVVYQSGPSPLLSRLVTYDNSGAAVLAPTTVWTRTGTAGNQFHRMAQLSNGNLAIAVYSQNTGASFGLYHGIVTTSGASVLAFANLDTVTTNNYTPDLSVMTGYYAVAKGNGTNMQAFVFDNTGALQGAGFSAATTGSTNLGTIKLLNDGTAFWLIWARSSDTKQVLTKLPTTGTGYTTSMIAVSSPVTNYNQNFDAFYENGFIVAVIAVGSQTYPGMLFVVSTGTAQLVSSSGTPVGSSGAGAAGLYPKLIAGGDFSFIFLSDANAASTTGFCVGKYANTAVVGVALAATTAGSLASLGGNPGAYVCNALKGSASKSFDHTATNLNGQKGTLLNYGAVMKGFI